MADLSGLSTLFSGLQERTGEKDTRKVLDYLYQLNEQLRYILTHLDEENFSEETAKTWQTVRSLPKALPTPETLREAAQRATGLFMGARGGNVVLRTAEDGTPYELLLMDTPDSTTAQQVWRWNQAGLGHSSTGIQGPYTTAITQDGHISAEFITTGTLSAQVISAFAQLMAGTPQAQRIVLGLDAYLDPYLRIYDVGDALSVELTDEGLRFGAAARLRPIQRGSRSGIGIFTGE